MKGIKLGLWLWLIFRDGIRRRCVVTSSLLILLVLFCGAIGFGLASNDVSGWGILVFSIIAMAALQIGYIVTVFMID
jgi:hypothetical protein